MPSSFVYFVQECWVVALSLEDYFCFSKVVVLQSYFHTKNLLVSGRSASCTVNSRSSFLFIPHSDAQWKLLVYSCVYMRIETLLTRAAVVAVKINVI